MALPRPLARLFTPHRAFDGDSTPLSVAVGTVLLVAVASAVSLSMAATPIAAAVDGTVTVDNPSRPSELVCEPNTDDAIEWNDETPESCTQPKQLERPLAGYAQSAVSGLAVPAFVSVVSAWLLSTAWLFAFGGGRENGSLATLAGDTSWALVPLLVPAAVRALLLGRTAERHQYGGTIESVEATARSAAAGAPLDPLFVVSAVALLWSGGILAVILQRRRDATRTEAGVVAAVPVVAVLVASYVQSPSPEPELTVVGSLFLLFGVPYALFPVQLIRFNARFELIGFRGDVEPEDWYVALHRFGGLLAACVGFLITAAPTLLV